ncbi:MAG TPA: methyltransferase domain-containing protein [Casimicrobiaceae bacterium]|nr:methyltransferase domain-containing protein [Casimicrobiaceae bacterium]
MDVDALMREIRSEIEMRGANAGNSRTNSTASERNIGGTSAVKLHRLTQPSPLLPTQDRYKLTDLLVFHDEDFIRNAYVALLGREPDVEGASRYLSKLRGGELSKTEILGRIRYSPEGRAANVDVDGLLVPFGLRTARRIPVIGYLLGLAQYALRLPTLVRNLERLEAVTFYHQRQIRKDFDAVEGQIESTMSAARDEASGRLDATVARIATIEDAAHRIDDQLRRVLPGIAAKLDRDEFLSQSRDLRSALVEQENAWASRLKRLEADKADRSSVEAILQLHSAANEAHAKRVTEELDNLRDHANCLAEDVQKIREAAGNDAADLHSLAGIVSTISAQLDHLDLELTLQERRFGTLLDSTSDKVTGDRESEPASIREQERDHLLDRFYVEFEERFRGTQEDISQRVSIYLPYIEKVGAGSANAPILDLGCGRGEWLELLTSRKLFAHGVDANRFVAALSRERGLNVVDADALGYLRSLPTGSLGAVTAIHVIEHMPFEKVVALFDEARRVLRSGGVAIFETPNPENLVVGACNFYYDPTHVRPLPPEPMRFVLEQRGFSDTEILRLHPRHDIPVPESPVHPLDAEVANRFLGAQDYAVIGYKRSVD